jgi:hypothetical protein
MHLEHLFEAPHMGFGFVEMAQESLLEQLTVAFSAIFGSAFTSCFSA